MPALHVDAAFHFLFRIYMTRIACFNVNSVNARINNLISWLVSASPDVVCLQELKCMDENFPYEQIENLGYNCLVYGQKSYNGVAILSKHSIEIENKGIPKFDDEQARFLEAIISLPNNKSVRVISVYCPNGNPIKNENDEPSEKFLYKLKFMDALNKHVKELHKFEENFVICGDWNIIPREEDCYDPKAWLGDALFRPESRGKWHEMQNIGLTDVFMALDGRSHQYTFWDYQGGAWARNFGIHIDTLLASPNAADCLKGYKIWRDERDLPKASDHVPVSADFEF